MVPPLFTQAGVLYTYVMGCYLDWRMLALSGVSSRVAEFRNAILLALSLEM